MSKGNGPLDFEATLDAAKLNYMLDEIERRIKGTANTAVREADKMDKAFSRVGMMIGGYFTAAFGAKMIGDMVNVRGEFQQLEIAFETMLKNKALSDQLMHDVVMFAARTPFDLKGVASGAKQLLAYGESAKDIIPTMTRLGDVAAGLSIPFGDLVYLYGTSRTQGKLMTKDLMQFAGRGVPIIEELSKVLKVSKAEVMDMASKSQISFTHLQKVMENLTSETGMFGGMMAKQAGSIPGLLSNLGDSWDRMLNKIGKSQQDTIASTIKLTTNLVDNYEEIIDILKVVIATYGTYKAVVMLNAAAMKGYDTALSAVIIKEKLLAIAQKATPFGLALTAITAVIGALYIYNKRLEQNKSITQEITSETSKEIVSMNDLFSTIKKATEGSKKRNDAIKIANDRYGKYLDNLLTEKSTLQDIEKAQRRVTNALIADIATKKSKEKLEEVIGDIGESFDSNFNKYISKYADKFGAERVGQFINDINEAVDKEISDNNGNIERTMLEFSKNAYQIWKQYGANIGITFKDFKDAFLDFAETKADNLPLMDQLQAMIKNYEQIVSGFNVDETTSSDDGGNGDKQLNTLQDLLEKKKKAYENYYKWLNIYGSESANEQYKNLVKDGESYLQWIEKQITTLESKTNRTSTEDKNLVGFMSERDELTGVKSRAEYIAESVEQAKNDIGSLKDYIDYLNEWIEAESMQNTGSERSIQIMQYLQNELTQAEKEIRKQSKETFQSLLDNSQNYADQRITVEKEYQDTVKKLDRESLGELDYAKALRLAEDIRNKKLDEITIEIIKQSNLYKILSGDVSRLNNTTLRAILDKLKLQLETLDKTTDDYQQLQQLINQTEEIMSSNDVENLRMASQLFGEMANRIGDTNKELSSALNSTSQLIDQFGQLKTAKVAGNGVGVFGTVMSILSIVADELDKQFGRQKRLADIESERLEYQRLQKLEIKQINQEIQDQIELLDKAIGLEKLDEFNNTYNQLRDKNLESLKALQDYQFEFVPAPDDLNAKVTLDFLREITKAKDDVEALNKALGSGIISQEDYDNAIGYLDTIKLSEEEMAKVEAQYKEFLTGTSYDSIVDGIVSAFDQGLTTAEYFASSFEDMMRKALLQSLSINTLQGPIQEWYDQFADASKDGLSKEEIAQLRESLEAIYSNAEEQAKILEEASGISISGNTSTKEDKLSSAVKGVNQQTAGLIAGYMNAIRINQAQSLSIMNKKLEVLNRIEINTSFSRLIYEYLIANPTNNTLPSTRIKG